MENKEVKLRCEFLARDLVTTFPAVPYAKAMTWCQKYGQDLQESRLDAARRLAQRFFAITDEEKRDVRTVLER